jgi:hypothetical protein
VILSLTPITCPNHLPRAHSVKCCHLCARTDPYMLANIYHRDAAAIAGSIIVSTVLSVVSIAVLVTLFTA